MGNVISVAPGIMAGGSDLYTPRPGFPTSAPMPGAPNTTIRVINPAVLTPASSVDIAKLETRSLELQAGLDRLVQAYEALRADLEDCQEREIEECLNLEIESIKKFTSGITGKVEGIMCEAEKEVETLGKL